MRLGTIVWTLLDMNYVVDDAILYILCYMCIWTVICICELRMQGLMGKQENSGKICTIFAVHMHTAKATAHGKECLCRAHAHGKGCPRCPPDVAVPTFAVHGGREAHGKAKSLPCELERKRTAKKLARQRGQTHGKGIRTATRPQLTATLRRSAKPLPCDFRATHGKDPFAGRIFAEQSLPCTAARQRLCRAGLSLCRAFGLHGKALFCRSVDPKAKQERRLEQKVYIQFGIEHDT
jgi:hypothetical protein